MKADPILEALRLPNGARFYKCALQVNPFEYLARHSRQSRFADETEYNSALVRACKERGIEVIAVTDHHRVRSAISLIELAKKAGIYVFGGFEAVTKDGVHFLCLFDPHRNYSTLERILGDCGIHGPEAESSPGKYDCQELLRECRDWDAICIAAHVSSDGGLLTTLSGQSRINVWKSRNLLACSLPGPVSQAPPEFRFILENKDGNHKREHRIAVVNAQDVCDPTDFDRPGAWTWVKMSEVSVEGLRQAFLDPESRIRLASDYPPEAHAEFVAIAWEGGFLDDAAIRFNENLNVLIGGRGTGKSTIIESLRCVLGLEPLGEDARRAYEGIVKNVLRSGTKISLLVRSPYPTGKQYRLDRTIPDPPVVRDEEGNLLNLRPYEIMPQVEIYGQHEISELTRSPEKLTHLLRRFAPYDPDLERRKAEIRRKLDQSRVKILELDKDLKQLEERLASLPGLEETLRRFQQAGLEERLREQSLLVREEGVFRVFEARLEPYRQILASLRRTLPIDRAFVSSKALEDLPNSRILSELEVILEDLERELTNGVECLQRALDSATNRLTSVRSRWEERAEEARARYEKILRELQRSKVDGEEFIRLRRQIETLRPVRDELATTRNLQKELQEERRGLLTEWEDVKAEEYRQLERAAKKVSRGLAGRVRVRVEFAGNRDALYGLLNEGIGGRLAETIKRLSALENLSLRELADAFRAGRDSLVEKYGIVSNQAERLAQAPPEVIMRLEELDLPPTTQIELNLAGEGEPEQWRRLGDLSTGQKATAVLLLLLLESNAPLIVDQPEDDLDNRFITEGVVPKMREEKRRRQFIFATHNANIPVLGDAELIVGLAASGEARTEGKARIPQEHMGSIDSRAVRELVEEVLEGGRTAFETRRLKYGY